MHNYKPQIGERLVSGLTYLTMGLFGAVWLIIGAVIRSFPSKFVMFNIFQSVFLSLCYVIINWIFWEIVKLIGFIPFINRIVMQILFLFNRPLVFGYSIVQCFLYGLIIYLAVFAFMGLYSYLPWVSDIIRANFKD